jgi:hypothetical protein
MTATRMEPRFLFPQSRQFPFDEVCEQIVRALEERSWEVPGIVVDFDIYGTGDEKYRMVRRIRGNDFQLQFGRPQGRLGKHWNDTAAITSITIPRKQLDVYDEEYGPTLWVYVGKNWNRDKARFTSSGKYNSKLNGEPRWYLRYTGGCDCRSTAGASFPAIGFLTATLTGDAKALSAMKHTHPGRRSPILVHDNDLGRESKSYRTDEVFAEFTQWLKGNVLAKILEVPPTDPSHYLPPEDFFRRQTNPWTKELTAHLGPIFCFGEYGAAARVHQGTTNVDELDPSDRYAFTGGGYRLLSLGVSNDGTVPEIAYAGFKWCGFGEVASEVPADTLDVPGHYRWSDKETYVFRVSPKRADGVYVADNAPYEKRRSELFEEIKPRDRLTDAEVAEATRARARTIIPITEYTGGYEQPVILVNRELDFNEVELVSGPWPECQYVWLLSSRFKALNRRDLLPMAVAEWEEYLSKGNRQHYDDAVNALLQVFGDGDEEMARAAEAFGRHTFRKVKMDDFFIKLIVETAATMRRLGLF